MKQLLAVIKKEIKSYIDHPMAYILVVVFLGINSFFFFQSNLAQEIASMRAFFAFLPWVYILFISALTMRTWAEEQKEKTLSVLLSYPIAVWKLVLGKFLATWVLVIASLILTLFIPLSLSAAGEFDWGVIFAQYLGATLLAGVMIAIGQWVSTLTKNQVVAFILSAAIQTVFILVGHDIVVITLVYPLNLIAQQLGLLSHFGSMARGVIDLRDILYFISVSLVFLGLSYVWIIKAKSKKSSPEFKKLQTSLAILIAIAVVINLFGQSFTARVDVTDQQLYSLSGSTKSLLKNLDDSVTITLYRSKKLPSQVELIERDIQDILSDYSKFGSRQVDLAVKYPDQNEDHAADAQSAGIPAVQFNVHREDEFTLQEGYLGLTVQYLDQQEVIQFVNTVDDLEFQLTRAIVRMQSDKQSRIGVVSDFGGMNLQEMQIFGQAVREDYAVELVKLQFAEDQEVPQIDPALDVVFFAGPKEPFSEPAISRVQEYVDNGGKVFWMMSGVTIDDTTLQAVQNATGLEPILVNQGVNLQANVIADLASHQNVSFGNGFLNNILPYPFWVVAGLEKHQLAGNLSQLMLPWPSSITLSEDSQAQVLATTTEAAIAQRDEFALNPYEFPDFSVMNQSERILAVALTDIAESGRWVLVANDRFLSDSILSQSPQNVGFALNALDWLTQNEALLSIRTKNSQPNTLVWESKNAKQFSKWGNILGVPVLVILFGSFWVMRRKKLNQK